MGRFTERCIGNLLEKPQVCAERVSEVMSLIIDNFQLTCDAQEDTVDLTRIERPDWYGNDFEKGRKVRLESYGSTMSDDINKQFEDYFDLVESYSSESEDEERYTPLRKLMKSSSLFLQYQLLVLYGFTCDFREQDCELRGTFEEGCANSILCTIDDFYSFIREAVDLCKVYKVDTREIAVGLFPTPKDTGLSSSDKGYIAKEDGTKDSIWKNGIAMNWKGQNNVLADMFRQAKNKGYLTNSIPDIVTSLKENFSCFTNTKLSTIETQLKDNNSSVSAFPKGERRTKIGN